MALNFFILIGYIRKFAYVSQCIRFLGPPTGIRIGVRVATSHIYDVYMSEQLKMKYRFYLKQVNDVAKAWFPILRGEANFVLLTAIQDPRKY